MDGVRYYIVPGAKTKMYTLRCRWEEDLYIQVDGATETYTVTRDQYMRNLSIDKDRAVSKAKEFLDDPSRLLSDSQNLEDLEAIRRRETEEVQAERERREAEFEAARISRQNEIVDDIIIRGIIPFGSRRGTRVESVDLGYALYWIKMENPDGDVVVDAMKQVMSRNFPKLVDLPKPNGKYVGLIKQRIEFTARVIESFCFEGFYGWVNVKKYVTTDGVLLTYMGSGSSPGDIGDTVTFKATIKKHEEYNGEASTYIMRPTETKGKK